jgi:hypothetical protein
MSNILYMLLYSKYLETNEETLYKGHILYQTLVLSVANIDEVNCKYKNPTSFSLIFDRERLEAET